MFIFLKAINHFFFYHDSYLFRMGVICMHSFTIYAPLLPELSDKLGLRPMACQTATNTVSASCEGRKVALSIARGLINCQKSV